MISKKDIFPIGIGMWGVGGFAERNPKNDDLKQVEAMRYMLDSGMNYVNVCPWNSEGHAVELFNKALNSSTVKRTDLFLSASIYHYRNEKLSDVSDEISRLLELFGTDYLDSVLFLYDGMKQWGISESIDYLKTKIAGKTTRYVSVSNVDLESLKLLNKKFENRLFAHEVQFNFEIRYNYDEGIMNYASENGILNVIYQPLRRNKSALRNWPLLVELSEKYSKTQNQILINWYVSNSYLPIVKSENVYHIKELIDGTKFSLEEDDVTRLNEFRPPNFTLPKVTFSSQEDGVIMHQLSNVFDEEYDKQLSSPK